MGYFFQMKQFNYKKSNVMLFAASALFLICYWGTASGEENLGFQKQSKEEEHRKYVERLSQDMGKVEKAIATTRVLIDQSSNRPYLPELYLRLAELYIEKSRIVYFIRKDITKVSESSLENLESNSLKNQAIEIYQRILNNFPDFPDRDKVHFFMAHEYRELGLFDNMIVQYREIIKKYKDSGYVPEAYLLLGDYFINKEDLDMAKRHYHAVLNYPESQAVGIARYKLAWCHINKAEYLEAIKLFEEAVAHTGSGKNLDVDTYKRVDIRLESLIDMAYCYGECYKTNTPDQALEYFRNYAWSRQAYMTVLEKLANRYLLKKKWQHAAAVYRELAGLQHDAEKLLDYSKNIFECVQAMESFADTDQDIEIIVKALKQQKYSIHIPDDKKKKSLHDFELYARDLVTHAHQKARSRKSKPDFKRAADSYKLYLDFFEDSPVYLDMANNYAETLFSSEQYFEAGKQYEKLMKKLPESSPKKGEMLYSSVISYYSALKNREELDYFQVAYARTGLRTTGKQYASAFPKSKNVSNVLFNVAWVSYDAGKYDDAIREFSSFVEAYPFGEPAKAAVHLVLDCYHLKEDYENLIQYGKHILSQSKINDPKFRKEVAGIIHGTETKIVSSLTVAAIDDWEKGKGDLIDFANQTSSSPSGMGEEALNVLMVSSKEKGDLETMLTAGEDLVRQYPTSGKVESTLGVMIDTSLKTARFRLVADYLESFAKRLPNHANTGNFLTQAGWIRKNLGQFDRSTDNFEQLLKSHGNEVSQKDEIIFAMADNAVQMRKPDMALGILSSNRNSLSKTGRIRSDAQVSDLYLQMGNIQSAGTYRKMACQQYNETMGRNDSDLRNDMAKMVYHTVHQQNQEYMALQLNNSLDNQIAARKAKLLDDLEKGYQSVMQYKSPDWALVACYRSYEINREFSTFLAGSPLPELSPEEKKQYADLIRQKADEYNQKSDQYMKTCVELAHKWEICDPKLAAFFASSSGSASEKTDFHSFSNSGSGVEISSRNLTDQNLKKLHEQLSQHPEDQNLLAALSEAYIQKGDFRQAMLITEKTLSEIKEKNSPIAARFYNNLGLSHLYIGNDQQAKDAFKKALDIDSSITSAKINLAGLFSYYGHYIEADKIYSTLPESGNLDKSEEIIHPRARELYYVQNKNSKS
jgi:cellulose synthase operon protein C